MSRCIHSCQCHPELHWTTRAETCCIELAENAHANAAKTIAQNQKLICAGCRRAAGRCGVPRSDGRAAGSGADAHRALLRASPAARRRAGPGRQALQNKNHGLRKLFHVPMTHIERSFKRHQQLAAAQGLAGKSCRMKPALRRPLTWQIEWIERSFERHQQLGGLECLGHVTQHAGQAASSAEMLHS